MTNPHDTPSRHSKKWDEEEKSNASPPSGTGRSYGGYDSGNYSSGNNPTDWTGGTGRSPYDRKRSRKPAIIIIIILSLIIIVILFGDDSILQNIDILQIFKIVNHCEELDTLSVNLQKTTGKISLQLCNYDELTLSSKFNQSSEVQISLYDSKSKNIYQKVFVGNEFEHIIPKKYYTPMEDHKIKTKVNGNYIPGELTFRVE